MPDNYARGRIIGDYRRMALYGIDRLIEAKKEDLRNLTGPMTEARIRLREEVEEAVYKRQLRCVGACGLAPVVMIGEKVYGRLQPVDAVSYTHLLSGIGYILKQYVLNSSSGSSTVFFIIKDT